MIEKAEQNKINNAKDLSRTKSQAKIVSSPSKLVQGKALLSKMKLDRVSSKPRARLSNTKVDKEYFIKTSFPN